MNGSCHFFNFCGSKEEENAWIFHLRDNLNRNPLTVTKKKQTSEEFGPQVKMFRCSDNIACNWLVLASSCDFQKLTSFSRFSVFSALALLSKILLAASLSTP